MLKKDIKELKVKILDDVLTQKWRLTNYATIKRKDYYANNIQSLYKYGLLWEEVFAEKYGDSPEEPYVAIRTTQLIETNENLQSFIDTIKDKSIAYKLVDFVMRRGFISTIYLPYELVVDRKVVPTEFIELINFLSNIKKGVSNV